MGDPIFPTLHFFWYCQWKIFPIWFYWPPNKREFEFKSQPVSSTFPHTVDLPLNPRESLFKILEAIRVPFLNWWRGSLPPMLTTLQSQIFLPGNLSNTSGDDLILKLDHLLILDGGFKRLCLMITNKARGFRFTPNPEIRVSLIMRICLKWILPLHMVAEKRGKCPRLNITQMGSNTWISVQGENHFM